MSKDKKAKYLLFDVETSSLYNTDLDAKHHKQAWIVQFAGLYLDKDLKVIDALDGLVQPPSEHSFMTSSAYDIHKIPIIRCREDGMSRERLRAFLNPVFVVDGIKLIAHNLRFDSLFLYSFARNNDELKIVSIKSKIGICTMEESRDYIKLPPTPKMRRYKNLKYKNPKLSELYSHLFGDTFAGAHDAQMDVTATHACLSELVELKVITL